MLRANELMIGDWVLADYKIGKQVYAKVGFTYPSYADRCHDRIGFIPVPMIDNLEQYINDERSIHPIPLTEEILKANGFEYNGAFWVYIKNDFERIFVRYCTYADGDMSEKSLSYFGNHWIVDENYRLDYVQELQHALRLCGLTELADNFKIK